MKNVEDQQFESTDDPADAALDQLLAQARWPEPSLLQQQEVRLTWQRISRRHRVRLAIWSVSIAAAAAWAVLIGWIALNSLSQPKHFVHVPLETQVKYLVSDGNALTEAEVHVPSRPANALERLALLAPKSQASKPPVVADMPDRVAPSPPVDQLVSRLGSRNVDERFEAARTLASMDDPHVIEVLKELSRNEDMRREALAALRWSINPMAQHILAELDLPLAARRQLDADEDHFSPLKQDQPRS